MGLSGNSCRFFLLKRNKMLDFSHTLVDAWRLGETLVCVGGFVWNHYLLSGIRSPSTSGDSGQRVCITGDSKEVQGW